MQLRLRMAATICSLIVLERCQSIIAVFQSDGWACKSDVIPCMFIFANLSPPHGLTLESNITKNVAVLDLPINPGLEVFNSIVPGPSNSPLNV